MNRSHLLIVVCLPFLSAAVFGQTYQTSKTGQSPTVAGSTKSVKDPEAERLALERRAQAQALLISLATDAATFNDQKLRARTQTRIADALWESDPDRARTLFRKAWDAAEVADADGQRRLQDEIREQQAKSRGGGYSVNPPPELRREILRLAAKHDPDLGEEFLAKLQDQRAQEASAGNNRPGSKERDAAVSQRLGIAQQLLSAGDTKGATRFADPVMGTVTTQTIGFLSSLREKNPAAADERYAAMLALAAADTQPNPNTASWLASYIFTPHLYVSFIGAGASAVQHGRDRNVPADVSPVLRAAFFRAAGEILMRPIPRGGLNPAFAGVINRYYVIKRLLPLFEQFAPPEATAGLRTHLEALASMLSEDQRRNQEESVREGIRPQEPKQNPDQTLLEKVDRVKTSAERDQLYLQLAISRADAANLSARGYVDKIEESELRRNARAYVDALLAYTTIGKRDPEQALEICRTGELTHLQRVWTMSHAAGLLMRTDRARALEVLDDATIEARRIGGSDPDRPRAFLAIANALLRIDRTRGWDLMNEVVKAANSAQAFTGDDGKLTFQIGGSSHQHGMGEFNVAEIFRSLGQDNYERAVELAQVFEREAPRTHAVMAVALAMLDKKK